VYENGCGANDLIRLINGCISSLIIVENGFAAAGKWFKYKITWIKKYIETAHVKCL